MFCLTPEPDIIVNLHEFKQYKFSVYTLYKAWYQGGRELLLILIETT